MPVWGCTESPSTAPASIILPKASFAAPLPVGYRLGSAALFELSGFELKGQTVIPAKFVRAFCPSTE